MASSVETIIRVRVQPKASENKILGFREDVLRLRVTAPPEDGKANAAVVRLLAQTLGISARTAMADWRLARAWLLRALDDGSC